MKNGPGNFRPSKPRFHLALALFLALIAFGFVLLIGLSVISTIQTLYGAPSNLMAEEASPGSPVGTLIPPTSTATKPPTATQFPTITSTPTNTPTQTPDPRLEEMLSQMTLSELVGQMIMTGVYGTASESVTCNLLNQIRPGAIVYRKGNVIDPWQLQTFSLGLKNCSDQAGIKGGLLIAIDHEGQYIYRFESGATRFPMQMAIGATGDLGMVNQVARAAGQELAYSGINMILGPVADIAINPANPDVSTRSFGSDANIVSSMTAIAASAYLSEGILPVIKHFPGTGTATTDPHVDLPIDNTDISTLFQHHLAPFRAGIGVGAPIVMVSHVVFPLIDSASRPSSLSPVMINEILKADLNFEGIVLTDALEMGAITKGYGVSIQDAAVLSIEAGADMVLIAAPHDAKLTHSRILEALQTGELSSDRAIDAVRRILKVKLAFDLDKESPTVSVDWSSNGALAEEVGRRAVTLVRDQANLIPMSDEWQSVLVVCPVWYSYLPNTIRSSGRNTYEVNYSLPLREPVAEGNLLRSIPRLAQHYDGVVVCTYDAYLTQFLYDDTSQVDMVQGLLVENIPTIVIALKSPFDLMRFAQAPTYLATFGTTQWQIQGVTEVILGLANPQGMSPVDLEP